MRRIAVPMIVAIVLVIAGYNGKRSGLGIGYRGDVLSGPVQTLVPPETTSAPPDGPCNEWWPRQGKLSGPLAEFAVSCYTDDGTSMEFRNTSDAVLRVTSEDPFVRTWWVSRPYDASWATAAVNQALPADIDASGAALLVPGSRLVAESAFPVRVNFTALPYESVVGWGSKVLGKYVDGIANRAKYKVNPTAALLQQATACAEAARNVFDAYVSQNEDLFIKVVDGIVPCVTFIQKVRQVVDDAPTPPPEIASELRQIARGAKISFVEVGLRLGARLAVGVSRLR